MTTEIEADLIHPLLRGRDVQRWKAIPSARILMVQDQALRRGIDEVELQRSYPRTYSYLKYFEHILRARAAFKRYFTRNGQDTGTFYSMFNVGQYTFAPYKVVWREVSNRLDAAVVGSLNHKVTMPDHTLLLLACKAEDEAHFICSILNSAAARLAIQSYIVLHPDPHIIRNMKIPKYAPDDAIHARLAELSKRAHSLANLGRRDGLWETEVEIDDAVARLWGIDPPELRDIQRDLAERFPDLLREALPQDA